MLEYAHNSKRRPQDELSDDEDEELSDEEGGAELANVFTLLHIDVNKC